MASLYGIIKIQDVEQIMNENLSEYKDSDDNLIFDDKNIEGIITLQEQLINATTKTTWNCDAPDNIKYAVKVMSKIALENILIKEGIGRYRNMELTDEILYFKEIVYPAIADEQRENEIKYITDVDDY